MTTFRYRRPVLKNKRDAAIIMHVVRNYITLAEVVHDLFFRGLTEDTSRKVLQRLVQRNYLTKYELFSNRNYFRLGSVAVNRWGYPRSRTRKLGAQRLPYELGALAYTCMDQIPRKRLLPHELKRRLPWFPESLMQWAYVWEQERLGTIRVEPRCRPQIVIQKFADQVYRYSEHDEFRHLIESQHLFLVCITATEQQELAIQQESIEQGLQVELITANFPELVRFI